MVEILSKNQEIGLCPVPLGAGFIHSVEHERKEST